MRPEDPDLDEIGVLCNELGNFPGNTLATAYLVIGVKTNVVPLVNTRQGQGG